MAQWVKNRPAMQEMKEMRVQSLGQKDPLEEERVSHPVFLPGIYHGQESLEGCSPRGPKESDMLSNYPFKLYPQWPTGV